MALEEHPELMVLSDSVVMVGSMRVHMVVVDVMSILNGHLVHVIVVLKSTAVDCDSVVSCVEALDKIVVPVGHRLDVGSVVIVDTVSVTVIVDSIVVS